MNINIPKLPSCRYRRHSDPEEASAEAFRDDVLVPALETGPITVNINPKYGMPVSWCEEVFGGLVRKLGASVVDRITIVGPVDDVLEATTFMREQAERQK